MKHQHPSTESYELLHNKLHKFLQKHKQLIKMGEGLKQSPPPIYAVPFKRATKTEVNTLIRKI